MAWASSAATPDDPPRRGSAHLPAAAQRERQPGYAALAVGGRRVLVEPHQMRADPLVIGGDRRGRCTGAGRGGGLSLAFDAGWRRRARRGGESFGFFASGRTIFGLTGVGLASGTGLAGSVAGFISTFCSGDATTSGFSCGGVGAICSRPPPAADRLGRRGIGLIHQLVRGALQRRRLRRGRYRRHVHHDRRQGNAGLRLWPRPVHADRDQGGMGGEDRHGRRAPAAQYGLVGNIVEREGVHDANCGRRGRPARS